MLNLRKKISKPKRLKSRGTVRILILLLVASASLRVVSSATTAFAEIEASADPVHISEAQTEPETLTINGAQELEPMLRAFQEREERIRKKEREIEQRLKVLASADQKITQRLSELEKAEQDLRATIALADSAAEDDLARLTVVYENMKPKVAASLFEEMAPDFAAGFLGRMRPDAAAAIMAGMTPESAYTVSTILAGRNANIPKN